MAYSLAFAFLESIRCNLQKAYTECNVLCSQRKFVSQAAEKCNPVLYCEVFLLCAAVSNRLDCSCKQMNGSLFMVKTINLFHIVATYPLLNPARCQRGLQYVVC